MGSSRAHDLGRRAWTSSSRESSTKDNPESDAPLTRHEGAQQKHRRAGTLSRLGKGTSTVPFEQATLSPELRSHEWSTPLKVGEIDMPLFVARDVFLSRFAAVG